MFSCGFWDVYLRIDGIKNMRYLSILVGLFAVCVVADGARAQTDLLLYNGDVSLINQTLNVDLKAGENQVATSQVSKLMVGQSARVIAPAGAPKLVQYKTVFYDGNNYVDEVFRRHMNGTVPMRLPEEGKEGRRVVNARVLGRSYFTGQNSYWNPYTWFYYVDGEVRTSSAYGGGDVSSFAITPEQSIQVLTPRLDLTLAATEPYKGPVTLSYLSRSIYWMGSYVLVVNPATGKADLSCSAVIQNQTDMAFPGARVKLVPLTLRSDQSSGQEGRATSVFYVSDGQKDRATQEPAVSEALNVVEIPNRLDVSPGSTQGIRLFGVEDVPVTRIYTFGHGWSWNGGYELNTGPGAGQSGDDKHIQAAWQVMNTKEGKLGQLLPGGEVSVYLKDAGGTQMMAGITPVGAVLPGDPMRVPTGPAPLTRAGRAYKVDRITSGDRAWRVTVYLKLVNAGSKDISVEVVESFDPRLSWKVVKSDYPHQVRGYNQSVVTVPVPKEGLTETTVEFEVSR